VVAWRGTAAGCDSPTRVGLSFASRADRARHTVARTAQCAGFFRPPSGWSAHRARASALGGTMIVGGLLLGVAMPFVDAALALDKPDPSGAAITPWLTQRADGAVHELHDSIEQPGR
jgi:hypothetical protein